MLLIAGLLAVVLLRLHKTNGFVWLSSKRRKTTFTKPSTQKFTEALASGCAAFVLRRFVDKDKLSIKHIQLDNRITGYLACQDFFGKLV